MRTLVQRWGNSLAVRIPKAFASEVGLDSGTPVDLTVEDGALAVRPAPAPAYRLGELLDRVTRANRHGETDVGPPAGGEVW